MSRSILLLASSTLKTFAFALIVVASLIAANQVAKAAPAPAACGFVLPCPNVPPCTKPLICSGTFILQNGNLVFTGCFCLAPLASQ